MDEGDETFTLRSVHPETIETDPNDPERDGKCELTIEDDDSIAQQANPDWVTDSDWAAGEVLVSNVGGNADYSVSFANDAAQAFTTGNDPRGYRLTGVSFSMQSSGTPVFEVYIAESAFSGGPGAKLVGLTGTLQSGATTAVFTPGDIVNLRPNRTYWVVVDVDTTASGTIWGKRSNAEHLGAASGWSIANDSRSRPAASTSWQHQSGKIKIAVHGQVRTRRTSDESPSPTSPATLVRNTGQTTAGTSAWAFSNGVAQSFTTGAHSTGYKLTGADLAITLGTPDNSTEPTYAVHVHSGGSGAPGASLGSLAKPSSLSAGVNRFEASFGGIDLEPGTTYWLVVDGRGEGDRGPRLELTASDNEDAGKEPGWSIANGGHSRGADGTWTSLTSSHAVKLGVRGYAKAAAVLPGAGDAAVSNVGQANSDAADFTKDHAMTFTTGSNTGGYKLTQVDLDLSVLTGAQPGYSVSIWPKNRAASLGTLTGPASLRTGINSFTADGDGITLTANTQYWVVVDVTSPGNASVLWRITSSSRLDAGIGAGWRMARAISTRDAGSGTWGVTLLRLKMAVHATATGTSPAAPAKLPLPAVSRTDGHSLEVQWEAPAAWPPISDYDVRYRRKGDTAWLEHDGTFELDPTRGRGTWTATIDELSRGVTFEAQVRATNRLGTSDWSDTATGTTGPARFLRADTAGNGETVTFYLTRDLISNTGGLGKDHKDYYELFVNGTKRTLDSITSQYNEFRPNQVSLNVFLNPFDHTDTVTVSYKGGTNPLRDADFGAPVVPFEKMPVTNHVQHAPEAPAAPTVAAEVTGDLSVSWTAPNAHPVYPVDDYDVRYFAHDTADPTDPADWIEAGEDGGHDHVGTATQAILTGLAANTAYRVQVRAGNSLWGEGDWSASGTATTGASEPAAPAAPTVAPAPGSASSLSVSWTAPATGGSAITDYDLRYYQGSGDPSDEAEWVEEHETSGLSSTDTQTASATIKGLAPSTAYRVQVRAGNAVGEGPWSASGTATTNASSSTTNNAPVRMMLGTSDCEQKTANTSFGTITVAAGTRGEASPLVDRTQCTGTSRKAPMFSDPDGDTLTFAAQVSSLPAAVRLGDGVPIVQLASGSEQGKVVVSGAARFEAADVRVDVTATDPEGASVSTFFLARVGAFADTGAPSFVRQAGPLLHVAADAAIDPIVLPLATGGDRGDRNEHGDFVFPYLYEVEGLPAGLSFDAATRQVTGTPTETGSFEITYTAEDADSVRTAADTASQTFVLRVGDGPRINRVRIVSHPTYDANGDGTPDTYVRGDKILIDVEFGAHQPVRIGGEKDVRLRLDLGADDANPGNSRKVLTSPTLLHGDETLRFAYTVQAADTDADGVWVQTVARNKMLFLVGTTTLTHADTGEDAALNLLGLPTTGNAFAKVDGSKTSADIGPRPTSAAVNGETLTVTFDKALNTSVDTARLKLDLEVRGAGGVNTGRRGVSQHPATVTASGSSLTLTLSVPARQGDDNITLSYVGGLLTGTDGKKAARFRDLAVTNNTGTAAGPEPLRARVAGSTLWVVFDGALVKTPAPDGSAFRVDTIDADDDQSRIDGAFATTIDGAVVQVTLKRAVSAGDSVSVSYTKPEDDPLKGAGTGNPPVMSFRHFHVRTVSDTAPPVLQGTGVVQTSAHPPRSKLVLYYDEPLDAASVPATRSFGLEVAGGATVSDVAVEGNAVVLTLDSRAPAGRAFAVRYVPGTNPIRDAAGNAAAQFRQTLSATAAGAPGAQSAAVDGARVVLTYDKPLDPASLPAPAAFTLHLTLTTTETEADRTPYGTVAAVEVVGKTAVLHLPNPVRPCDGAVPFTVSYAGPAGSPLQGLDGADAADFFAVQVTNARSDMCDADGIESAAEGSIILRGRRPFETGGTPQAAWFTVTASGGAVTVTGAAFSTEDPHELILTLSRDFVAGETVTVSYRRPRGARGLWSADGYQLADVIDLPVTMRAAALPAVPAAPAVTQASGTSVTLRWAGPAADGQAAVTGYGVRYRRQGAAEWTGHAHAGTGTSATIPGLAAGHRFEAQVRATGPGGDSPWSESGWGHTGAARFESAATPASGRAVTLVFTKAIRTAGLHTDYTVRVDGARRGTTHGSLQDDTVGLVLAEPVRSGETVTVAYAKPASGAVLRDADELAVASFGPEAVANTVPRPANVPATGAPASEGAARVGETLTASAAGIADANGLAGATFAFQWVSISGGADADIAGATGARYTLTQAEAGRTVKVRVTFTDDAGYRETLTSAATEAVAPRVPPLTAAFVGVPAEHDGRRLFGFELRFSEDFPGRFDYRVLRDHAFVVTGGRVREAKRVVRGRNDRWTISVRPASFEDVTITLPAAADCAPVGAVCTEAGRKLANTVATTVRGPATLSVADAEAHEGADEAVEFAVTLSRAASGVVTVDYVTLDGTAVAGEDYTRTRGTLSFARGELEKSVSVPILDDVLDEGSETFTLRLRNAQGAAVADGEAVGTITNADPLQKLWLSRFGRTAAGHVTEAVSDRLANPLSGAQVTLGGQTVDLLAATEDEAWLGQTLTSLAMLLGGPSGPGLGDEPGSAFPGSGPGQAGAGGWPGTGVGVGEAPAGAGGPARLPSGRDLLLGSAFHLAREGGGTGPNLAAWGRVTTGGFDGEAPAETGNVRIDGEVTTGILGTDAEWNRLLAGVAVSVSEGEGTFDQPGVDSGTVESTMTAVSPYARFMVNDRLSAWGLLGYGTGGMTIVQAANDRGQPERVTRTDLAMRLAALGGRGALLTQDETGGIDLALRADAFYVETEAEAVSNEGATTGAASRARLILEGGRAFMAGGGATLRPSLEVGLRHDGGDAETGTGVELGGGVSYADPETGLSVEAKARLLVAHADSDYEEWGVSGSVRLEPGERGRGLSLSLSPTLGQSSSAAERLWGAQRPDDFAPGGVGFEAARGLAGELGYGLGLFGDRFTGTPNVGFGLSESARDYRIGWRLTSAVPGDPGFEVNLAATRREAANGDEPPEHRVMLRSLIRW